MRYKAITFTVFGNECQGEKGMKWQDWINSSYNNIYIETLETTSGEIHLMYTEESMERIYYSDGVNPVAIEDEIVANEAYGPRNNSVTFIVDGVAYTVAFDEVSDLPSMSAVLGYCIRRNYSYNL